MSAAERVAKRYVVHGRVQGVGFRYFTVSVARQLGLSGWVRNAVDGTVEVEAGGERGAMAEFERRLAAGPRGARVTRVEEGGPRDGQEEGEFRIVY